MWESNAFLVCLMPDKADQSCETKLKHDIVVRKPEGWGAALVIVTDCQIGWSVVNYKTKTLIGGALIFFICFKKEQFYFQIAAA